MGDDTKFSYFVRELTNIRCDDGYFEGLRSTYDSSQRQGRTPWFWPFRRIAYLASAAAYSFMEHSLGTKSEQQSIISWNVNGLEQKKRSIFFLHYYDNVLGSWGARNRKGVNGSRRL